MLRLFHYGASLLAIALGWLMAHISFGLHYMHMYYNDTIPEDEAQFDEGMSYPEQKMPDYWNFIYYSFTIAMCYQTSDVTITNPSIRRVTLLHAIYSFFFVATILALVINILSNII